MLNATTGYRFDSIARAAKIRTVPAATGITPLEDMFSAIGALVAYASRDEIFAEEDTAEAVYRIVSGVVRICKFTEDGRRQIGEFHFPGDMFGLEADRVHNFSAEAVTDCRIQTVKRRDLIEAARRDGELASALWDASSRELHRLHEHLFLLGRASAADRVMGFLRTMGERLRSPGVVDIPMSRQDIADHLGLNIETVSRTITQLRSEGAISLEGARRIRVCDDDLCAA